MLYHTLRNEKIKENLKKAGGAVAGVAGTVGSVAIAVVTKGKVGKK